MTSIQSLDYLRKRRHGEAVLRRMEWIENRLYWTGSLRRRDVCSKFEISPQQASVDIAAYARLRPANLMFVNENKTYVKGQDFDPIFPKDAGSWLDSEKEKLSTIGFARVTSPWQPAADSVLTALIASSERKIPISVLYFSLSRRAPIRRILCPHTIVDADGRLHVRAFDYERRRFSDFLVSRISDARDDDSVAWVDLAADIDWHEYVTVQVGPNPELSSEQARAGMKDLGLPVNGGGVKTRRALVFYLIRMLRLANFEGPDPGRRYVCLNRDEVSIWLGSDKQAGDGEP